MRIWSISPCYLDNIGLARCFNETKLALNCLLNPNHKYSNHSQLIRWKNCKDPIQYLTNYLWVILQERKRRGSIEKGTWEFPSLTANICNGQMTVTQEQLEYEFKHLEIKLWKRKREQYFKNAHERGIEFLGYTNEAKPHPIFKVVPGPIESWEKVK